METMFLVAGLAVAGLAGIAAAFYFSIRSGNRGNKRPRSAGSDRADAGRLPGSRSGRTPRPDRTENGRQATDGSTGPDPVPDFGDQVLVSGRRGAPGGSATPGGGRRPSARTGEPPVSQRLGDHAAGGAAKTAKPRRRGFRKGADLDEELWPAESFGGVSDEQFWDDMASDKPLTTTARTAQQDPGTRNRPFDAGPATDPQAVPARGDDRKRDSVTRDDRHRGEGRRGEDSHGAGSGAYPGPRTAPNPAAERTAIQPAYAATQPVQSMTQPVQSMTQPVQSMTQPVQSMTSQRPDATRPVRPPAGTSQPISAASQPRGAATQPAEPRRRRPSSAEEDPLTSAAFSLRSSGPVDGRSSLRARDTTRNQYDAGGSGPGSAGSYGGTSPYPYATPSHGDPSSVTQTMNTPPYGENYGYGSGGPASQAVEPPRQNGTRRHARPDGLGDGTRAARQEYPREARQATGGYPASSARPGNSAYPGNGYQGNGHRAPYDPRDDYRRLTHQP
jgi:hypothetical protein